MGGMRGSSHKRVPVALKLPQLQVSAFLFEEGHFTIRSRLRQQQALSYISLEEGV